MDVDAHLFYDRFSLPARIGTHMKRREFLTKTALAGALGLSMPVSRIYAAQAGYTGRLLVTLQVEGGWDVTSFCDPKVNQPGEPIITNWSTNATIQSAGNINYAPFADNATFFNKYFQDMLVINGVDMQTNSHTTGVLHSWSGRNSTGFPSLTAMFSALNAPDQPLSYINFGGFSQTSDLIRFSRLDDVNTLRQLLEPEIAGQDSTFRTAEDMARIRNFRNQRLARLLDDPSNLPRMQKNLEAYQFALSSKAALVDFKSFIPSNSEIFENEDRGPAGQSNLRRQIQMTIAAFEAGVASASDLIDYGYDTHADHDSLHTALYTHLTDSLDLFWTLAEEKGIANRITLVIGSDFSRTPLYNADNGKDHWPIGSVIVMEKAPIWGNRVIGLTDEVQNAYNINPATLARDDATGTIIYPKHVHKALRRYLGMEDTVVDAAFKFNNTEDFDFFG